MRDGQKLPKELRRLLNQLTDEDRLRKFRHAHGRDPAGDEELDRFILSVARELYNEGWDEWPDGEGTDEEVD